MHKGSVFLRQATLADIDALEQLLNRCYRQKTGWTNEADLIGGIRTTAASLTAVINDPCHYFLCIQRQPQANVTEMKRVSC